MLFTGNNSAVISEKENPVKIEESKAVRTIVINANDQMRFDTSEIKVKAGDRVRLTLNHTGKLAKNVMGHNFVLLTQGTDVAKFAQAAMSEKDNDYIPSTGFIAHTKIVGGGESTSIEFNAPKKGTYDFLCSFPGHYAMMKGKFIVE
ncbi:azurin [Christiangramia fulva]|uniref:Azurin n=2 Tax=Christiangramia fulva TaxID=2126553 RepID=A0A2R3Z995_9FLAO|nr:azurin [Christiangramia fulva]